ncbi:MAG TPA: hypothetical protein VJR46_13440 [Candidatus Dormibacteraeota bacterium]|nr:hypothetical protein [Candidatus Dormibacteraeota bacterium]
MKTGNCALLLLAALTACTQIVPGEGTASSTRVASGVRTQAPAGPPYGVLVDLLSDQARYTLAVVAMDGRVVAAETAARRTLFPTAAGMPLELPYVSTTSSALYYLDGDSNLYTLSLEDMDAEPRLVRNLSVAQGAEVAFAVSPDDTRIAIGSLDFRQSPAHVQVTTDNLTGGDRRVIYDSDTNYVWPVAWHAGLLVLAHAYGPYVEDVAKAAPGRDNPYFAISYHVVDPVTARRVVLMGSCTVSGPLSPMGSACIQGGAIDWSGQTAPWGTHNWGSISAAASISQDGQFIAAARPDDQSYLGIWRPHGELATYVQGPGAKEWAGWLDATHIVITSGTSLGFQPRALELATGPTQAMFIAAHGFYAARLPTDVT